MVDLEQGARKIEASRVRQPEGERLHALFDLLWDCTLATGVLI